MIRRSFQLSRIRMPLMAALLLAVFVARFATGLLCEPHEFAELFGTKGSPTVLASDVDGDDSSIDHGQDHCRQCQCHHGVALPNVSSVPIQRFDSVAIVLTISPHANAPPQQSLRPPIV